MLARLRFALGVTLCFAGVGCGAGDDTASVAPAAMASADGGSRDATTADAGVGTPEGGGASGAGPAAATFSSSPIDVGLVPCSATGTATFMIGNSGPGPLSLSASTTGTTFSVTPATLTVAAGAPPATLTITATVPGSSAAGTPLTGSLNLFTNDPANSTIAVGLSATPSGATIAFASSTYTSVHFPSTEVGQPATPLSISLTNIGNAPATVEVDAPVNTGFSMVGAPDGGQLTITAGGVIAETFGFTPNTASQATGTALVTVTGTTCGTSISQIGLAGQGATGTITGYPTGPLDFGFAECGGGRAAPQTFTLKNVGTIDAHVTKASIAGAAGFSTSAAVGQRVPANGGTLLVAFSGPLVPTPSPLTPVTATLTFQTDADPTPQTIALTAEPHGAVLAFDTTPSPSFGSFGRNVLLQSTTQPFNVVNTGNEAAGVTLVATSSGSDATPPGGPPTFSLSNGSFAIGPNGTQTDATTYSALATGIQTGTLAMTATGSLCGPLPAPLPLTGSGIGGGPSVAPSSIAFSATCGGAQPPPQTFSISNHGDTDLNWAMQSVTGPGAAQYAVSASPAPGLLHPGASAILTVRALAIPSPAGNANPSAYAAQLAITTDVPFDTAHVVSLGEVPLGDQLSVSTSLLRFGQFPIDTTTLGQSFTVTNSANAGSPAATFAVALQGTGASAYAVSPAGASNLGGSGATSGKLSVTFDPSAPTAYPATLAITTSDSLCTPLPSAIALTGTGTQGKVSVSATTLAFGTDPGDPQGLVNCGATGLAQAFTVSNAGNQAFDITALTLGLGAASPYVVSGLTLPATLAIGGTATITVTPKAIPSAVANPADASPFTDTLTLTTNAALDAPHRVSLVMQARGAVIAATPLTTTWDFGTLAGGVIGSFATTITNTGNAPASVSFSGLQHPTVFGLKNTPTIVAASGVTDVIGQFSPPATNQQWTDQGTLVVTPAQVFCEPLPASWSNPSISLSGSSISGSLPVTVAGSLSFPSTGCGSAAPAGQSITLTNTTSLPYVFSARLSSGAFYTLQNPTMGDAGAGIIAGNGVVVLGVTPTTVTPGPAVVAGAAPYADNLIVDIQSQPPSGVTIPISWTLDGAMLSLPQGLGSNRDAMGNQFYAADTTSGLLLPMANAGTGTATVQFGVQPAGAFSFSPAPPIAIEPGIPALPRLLGASSDAACPALTPGSLTFLYSGPVCRPFPVSQVSIQSCVGTF